MRVLRVCSASLRKLRSLCDLSSPWVFSAFPPRLRRALPRRMGPAAGLSGVSSPQEHPTSVDACAPRLLRVSPKLRSLCDLSSPWVFSAFAPRLRVSASNGPRRWPVGSFLAPRTSTSVDACAPRPPRLSETPLPLRPFLTLGLLRVCSASPPGLRVEWAPPLARREFPRPENIDISRCTCSAPSAPLRKLRSLCDLSLPWVFSAFPPRLRVSASPRRMGPAAGLSGVSSPREHRHQSMRVLRVCSALSETPLPLRPFLTLGLLRVSSASPRPRVEWAPPLACREFPRPGARRERAVWILRSRVRPSGGEHPALRQASCRPVRRSGRSLEGHRFLHSNAPGSAVAPSPGQCACIMGAACPPTARSSFF